MACFIFLLFSFYQAEIIMNVTDQQGVRKSETALIKVTVNLGFLGNGSLCGCLTSTGSFWCCQLSSFPFRNGRSTIAWTFPHTYISKGKSTDF